MADGGDQGNGAVGCGPHHHFFVEGPQILHAATAAGDDDEVGPGDRATGLKRIEAANAGRHFGCGCLALHARRPDQDVAREAVAQPVQDVANHSA